MAEMTEADCAATTSYALLQRQQKLEHLAVPEAHDDSIWSPHCFAYRSCVCLLVLVLFTLLVYFAVQIRLNGTQPTTSSGRNPHVDNAKFLGMVLVCWTLWFHMPVFIFLSGSFVRPFSPQLLQKTFVTLVMPLVFFILILFPMNNILAEGWMVNPWLDTEPMHESSAWAVALSQGPGWIIWFLRCLILWRVVSMFTCQLPNKLQIFLAVVSVFVGVYWPLGRNEWDLGIFGIRRALCLFPIFVMGQYVDLGRILQAIPGPSKVSEPSVLVTWTLILSLIFMEQSSEWGIMTLGVFDVMGRKPNKSFPFARYPLVPNCPSDYYFMWVRSFACLIYRVLCMFLFLLLGVPREKTWFTEAGSRTMYAYLLHLPWVQLTNKAVCRLASHSVQPFGSFNSIGGYVHFMTFAFLLTGFFALLVYGLTSKPVVALFSPLIEPTWIQRIFRSADFSPKEVS